jgi:hypothetical protein
MLSWVINKLVDSEQPYRSLKPVQLSIFVVAHVKS